jgi:tetratricopeptide (TPR) repeat protein
MKNLSLLAVAVSLLLFSCKQQPEKQETPPDYLGVLQYNFPVSEDAKASFDKGLLLLHSFEYEDAAEAFEEAIAADSTEVMAFWGLAMTEYKALWGLQDVPAGQAYLARLGSSKDERLTKAEEGLERDFLLGVEILYGEGDQVTRQQAYADHMGSLYKRYDGDQEVAAFYSLALMWSVPVGRNAEIFNRSAQVAEGILKENPNHPGALHYTIHAYDDPEAASLAINAANKYAKVAPDAVHALHMPSHIYLASGMWDEVVSSNEVSYAASVTRMEQKGLTDKARGYHSFFWLHYGYLQQGRFEKATELMKEMIRLTPLANSPGSNAYLVAMQNSQLAETGEWSLTEMPLKMDYEKLSLDGKSKENFFQALMAYNVGDAATIKTQMAQLQPEIAAAKLLVTTEGVAMCSAGPSRYAPDKNSILRGNVMINEMGALLALSEKNDTKAEGHFKSAVEFENQSEYAFGPPDVPYPSFELYGEWLLERGRFADALAQFENSLERAPLRAKALKGKITALKGLGRNDDAAEVQTQLDAFWQPALMASL